MTTPAPEARPAADTLIAPTQHPALAPGALGEAISRVWTEEKVCLPFIKDWQSTWRLAYEVPARCLLTLLVLQRELRDAARHSGYASYQMDAELNIARIEARMGIALTPTGVLTEFERAFLDWLRGAETAPQPSGRRDMESIVWEGVNLYEGGSPSRLLKFADRETPRWMRNTPLGYVKDRCRRRGVWLLCADGKERAAEPYAAGCGLRGQPLVEWIEYRLRPSEVKREAGHSLASYQAYLCEREIAKLEKLGLRATADDVKVELDEWKRLVTVFSGGKGP